MIICNSDEVSTMLAHSLFVAYILLVSNRVISNQSHRDVPVSEQHYHSSSQNSPEKGIQKEQTATCTEIFTAVLSIPKTLKNWKELHVQNRFTIH